MNEEIYKGEFADAGWNGKTETFYPLFSDLTKRWAKEQMKTNATTEAVRQVNAAQTIDNPPPSR